MGDAISSMLEAMQSPETRHAALVHMPVALSVLGVLLAVTTGIWSRQAALRWAMIVAYVLLAVSAWMASESGEDVHAQWGVPIMAEAVYDTVDRHMDNAEKVAPAALAIAVVAAVGAVARHRKRKRLQVAATWLAAAGGLGLAAWVAWVAHLGGTMVYEHGVGTPFPVAAAGGPLGGARATPLPGGDGNSSPDPRLVVFRQVKPILEEHCMRCHNPKRARRSGGLDQTSIAGILAGGNRGPAVIPGRPDESLLLQAARHEIEDLEMPPDDDPLPDEALAAIEQWIRQGAVWE